MREDQRRNGYLRPPTRPRHVLLELLEDRYNEFLKLPQLQKDVVNSKRMVSMEEMWDILQYFLITGRFMDEELWYPAPTDPRRNHAR